MERCSEYKRSCHGGRGHGIGCRVGVLGEEGAVMAWQGPSGEQQIQGLRGALVHTQDCLTGPMDSAYTVICLGPLRSTQTQELVKTCYSISPILVTSLKPALPFPGCLGWGLLRTCLPRPEEISQRPGMETKASGAYKIFLPP